MPEDGPRIDVRREGAVLGSVALSGAKRRWLIGRSLDADLVVNHPSVSRSHAAITEEGGAFFVTDLGSAHGTKVAGTPLAPQQPFRLFDGLPITVGGTTRTLVPVGTVIEKLKSAVKECL